MASCPSRIHHTFIPFFISNPHHHAFPNAFRLHPWNSSSVEWRRTPDRRRLYRMLWGKPSVEWCSSAKFGSHVSLFPVPIFCVNTTSSPLILGRSFLKTVGTIDVGKGRSGSSSMAWGVHSSQPWFEVWNTIHVKYILPHLRIWREESRENEAKKTQSSCIRQDQESTPACEDQKVTKPKNKSTPKPRMV
jgi:hypothetical protein